MKTNMGFICSNKPQMTERCTCCWITLIRVTYYACLIFQGGKFQHGLKLLNSNIWETDKGQFSKVQLNLWDPSTREIKLYCTAQKQEFMPLYCALWIYESVHMSALFVRPLHSTQISESHNSKHNFDSFVWSSQTHLLPSHSECLILVGSTKGFIILCPHLTLHHNLNQVATCINFDTLTCCKTGPRGLFTWYDSWCWSSWLKSFPSQPLFASKQDSFGVSKQM